MLSDFQKPAALRSWSWAFWSELKPERTFLILTFYSLNYSNVFEANGEIFVSGSDQEKTVSATSVDSPITKG